MCASIVVMGVSGCGKSTVADRLARELGGLYLDADELHSPEAVAKMAAGVPLTDEDRAPWLERVGDRLADASHASPVVIACSALRRRYRDVLRERGGDVIFVHLAGPAELIEARMTARAEHYMPSSLLASQVATLEPLETGEVGVTLSIEHGVSQITIDARRAIAALLTGDGRADQREAPGVPKVRTRSVGGGSPATA